MVDSINPIGHTQNVSSDSKPQKTTSLNKAEAYEARAVDAVNISDEALNLAQIEDVAKQVAEQLSHNQSETLSQDTKRLSTLA